MIKKLDKGIGINFHLKPAAALHHRDGAMHCLYPVSGHVKK